MEAFFFLMVIIIIVLLLCIPRYNDLRRLNNSIIRDRSNVRVLLKRRRDLFDNLADVVTSYTKHENKTLLSTTKLRSNPNDNDNQNLNLRNPLAIAEQYPELHASANFLKLSDDIRDTENQISEARQDLNESVKQYNDERSTFPNVIILGWAFPVEDYASFESELDKNDTVDLENRITGESVATSEQ